MVQDQLVTCIPSLRKTLTFEDGHHGEEQVHVDESEKTIIMEVDHVVMLHMCAQ